ncbi:MAG: zinc-ribbon domain-containing protein [Chloroflexi bacterium]|nr:zinc-ribbon domain-containing protein [Chloroflexota bacterium]
MAKRRKTETEGKMKEQMTEWNKCPGCGDTISSVAAYCPNCGEHWTVKCSKCEASWRFWKFHKFCPDCGAPVEKFANVHR